MCLFRFFPVWLTWIMIWGSLWTHILSLYNQNYGPKLGCGPIRSFFCPNAQSGTKILSAGPKCSMQGSGPKCLLFVLGRPKWILCRLLKSFLHSSLPCTLGQIILILKTPFCFMNVDKIKEEQIVYWPFECHLQGQRKGGAGGARAPPVLERITYRFTQRFAFSDAFCTSCTPCF